MLNFKEMINTAKEGEKIFEEDFLQHKKIKYENVSTIISYQKLDIDFVTENNSYEIKSNYKDNGWLFLEEFNNCNSKLGQISFGWLRKSKASKIVFVSIKTRNMIILNFNKDFKERYMIVRNQYPTRINEISTHNGRKWQSSYKYIPLEEFNGMYYKYQKNN